MSADKGKKFESLEAALAYANRKNSRQPEYDWYIVAAGDAALWYVYRGGEYPRLYNGAQVVWWNGGFSAGVTGPVAS